MASGKSNGGQSMLAQLKAMIEREFTPEQLAELKKRLEESSEQSEKLRKTRLANADEPEIVFQPYRKDDQGT